MRSMLTPLARALPHAATCVQASPFSNCLLRLPDLTPPRTKFDTSLGSVYSPAPPTGYGAMRFAG